MAAGSAPTEVVVGLRFRTVVHDEKPLFEAKEMVGVLRDVPYWECLGLDGEAEGEIYTFPDKLILGALRLSEIFGGYDPDDPVWQPINYDDRLEKLL